MAQWSAAKRDELLVERYADVAVQRSWRRRCSPPSGRRWVMSTATRVLPVSMVPSRRVHLVIRSAAVAQVAEAAGRARATAPAIARHDGPKRPVSPRGLSERQAPWHSRP